MNLKWPDGAINLKCQRCQHPLAGHLDTAGHFIKGCHFGWDDGLPLEVGCQCPGFELEFEKVQESKES